MKDSLIRGSGRQKREGGIQGSQIVLSAVNIHRIFIGIMHKFIWFLFCANAYSAKIDTELKP